MPRDRQQYGEDPIDRIEVTLVTGTDDGADTNGEVYVTVAGREFNVKRRNYDDRKAGAVDQYVLGHGTNIEHPAENDPRGMPIYMVWDNPIGLRFEPQASVNPPDTWQLNDAYLSVFTEGGYEDFCSLEASLAPRWLGFHFGLVLHGFAREIQDEDKTPLKTKRPE
jgi:hypothetical protein